VAEPQVAQLPFERRREARHVLARAFDDDPVFRYLYPARRRRRLAAGGLLAATVRDAMPFEQVWAAFDDGRVIGVAAWLPDGAFQQSALRQARQLAGASAAFLTPATVAEGLRYIGCMHRLHPHDAHWYLAVLGVEPAWQGRGVGARLLTDTLKRLDGEGVPAYLETSKESNVAWYARRRFVTRAETRPARRGPPIWTMWREPAA
jgi:GNAT superfamily N-acetyltransferase